MCQETKFTPIPTPDPIHHFIPLKATEPLPLQVDLNTSPTKTFPFPPALVVVKTGAMRTWIVTDIHTTTHFVRTWVSTTAVVRGALQDGSQSMFRHTIKHEMIGLHGMKMAIRHLPTQKPPPGELQLLSLTKAAVGHIMTTGSRMIQETFH